MASRAEWTNRVKRWQASGLSATEFAEQEHLNERSLYWWRWKLAGSARPPPASVSSAFLPVRVIEARSEAPRPAVPFEVELPNGRVVRVPPDFDGAALERLLAIVAAGRC